MPQEIRMPSLGQTTEELRIVAWLKAEGDTVKVGEPLLEVETDKATLEIESFTSGTLLKILRGPDEVVEAGELLAYIGALGETIPTPKTETPMPINTTVVSLIPETTSDTRMDGDKLLASPVARQLAKDHGIDLAQVQGTGPDGRIEKSDVLAFIDALHR